MTRQQDLFPTLVDPNRKRLGEWQEDSKGRRRLAGRWNLFRVAEYLKGRTTWVEVEELARLVYHLNSKTNCSNVRKHIASQRRYMLDSLDLPLVTRRGFHGIIMAVKVFNPLYDEDKVLLKMDLARALDRREMTQDRYDHLNRIYLLSETATPPAA